MIELKLHSFVQSLVDEADQLSEADRRVLSDWIARRWDAELVKLFGLVPAGPFPVEMLAPAAASPEPLCGCRVIHTCGFVCT